MRALLLILLSLGSLPALGAESYWDLDTVLSHAKREGGVTLVSEGQSPATFRLDYVEKLDEIRQRMSSQSGVYPKVLISDASEVNAYATTVSGQPITVYTLGLLRRIGYDYDALAAVVAHEFAHLSLSHGSSRQTTTALLDILGTLALIAIDSRYGGAAYNPYRGAYQTGLNLGATVLKASYTRDQELEADATGVRWMIAAGFPLEGAIRLHRDLIPSGSSFLSTHPSSNRRIEQIAEAGRTTGTPSHTQTASIEYQSEARVNKSRDNTFASDGSLAAFASACKSQGLDPLSSKFDACVIKLARARKSAEGEQAGWSEGALVGAVVANLADRKVALVSSSTASNLPTGAKVGFKDGDALVPGIVERFYDGYYLVAVSEGKTVTPGTSVVFISTPSP